MANVLKINETTTMDVRASGEMATHIARVAARLFAAQGYDATSVREIVEAAGVTKPTLYYYFGSKQGLGEALLTKPMSAFIGRLRGLLDHETDPIQLMRKTFAAHFDFLCSEPDRCRFFYAICFGPNSTSLQEEMHAFGECMNLVMVECARKLAEAGLMDVDRVEAFSVASRGLIIASSMDALFCGQVVTPDLADRAVDDLLLGFGQPEIQTRIRLHSHPDRGSSS